MERTLTMLLLVLATFWVSQAEAQSEKNYEKVFRSCDMRLIKPLVEQQSFNQSTTTEKGLTPLHFAARYGCARAVELILQNGGKVNQTNKKGRTALFAAVDLKEQDQLEAKPGIVEQLIDQGADLSIQDEAGNTALHLFFKENRPNAENDGAYKLVFAELMEGAPALHIENEKGFTALYCFYEQVPMRFKGTKGIYLELFSEGADPTKAMAGLEGQSLIDKAQEKPHNERNKGLLEAWNLWQKRKESVE